jgi:aminodeoxyfutalosine synthase
MEVELAADTKFRDITDKVRRDERLSRHEGVRLMNSDDILTLGRMADTVRRRKAGDHAYYGTNLNINYTNICVSRCRLCAFSRDGEDEGAYVMPLDEIEKKVSLWARKGLREVHIVGGLHNGLKIGYFEEMLRRIKSIDRRVFIQAFTAVEIEHFAKVSDITVGEVLRRLKESGLGAIPGGGAEVFSERVRKEICEHKISGQRWLEIMEEAHNLGIRSNATMLYGHIETGEERVEHLLALRELQDRTGGFLCFVPLAFHPQNTGLSTRTKGTSGYDDLRVLAVSRILLDNFDHIKSLWMYLGMRMAQVALSFGVDDLGATSIEEKIVHAAGARTPDRIEPSGLIRLIEKAGRIPVEVDSSYTRRN